MNSKFKSAQTLLNDFVLTRAFLLYNNHQGCLYAPRIPQYFGAQELKS